MLHTVLETCQ